MKRRTLTLTLSILACIALIGVGFASWVITKEDSEEVSGNINVDTVEDKTHFITIINDSTKDLNVYFGAPKNPIENAWLKNDTMNKEDLVASFKIEVTNYKTAIITSTDVTIGVAYATLVTVDAVSISAFSPKEGESTTGVATVTIQFHWGSDFETKNPYEFYNGKSFSTELAATAKTKLSKLAELNGTTFTITLTTSTKPATE